MKRVWQVLMLSAAVSVFTGCTSVVGRWALDSVTPEQVRGHYTLVHLALNKDGTYAAVAKKGNEKVTSEGKYIYEKPKLTFTSETGKVRTYDARLIALGTKMEVKTTAEDEQVTAVMKRHRCKCKTCQPDKCEEPDSPLKK